MQDKIIYEYAVIRMVPKVEREEFINVGVILFSKKKKYLDIIYTIDKERLSCFSKDIDCQHIEDYLKAWEVVCQGGPKGGVIGQLDMSVRFRWLTAFRSSIIQSSRVHPGLTDNPAKTLKELFQFYVS